MSVLNDHLDLKPRSDGFGVSTRFMVELKETSDILAGVTSKSFVILDELGRGEWVAAEQTALCS